MKKKIEKAVEILPDVMTNAADWLKNNFNENGQEILGNASGSAGLLIKFFGGPLIDRYFAKKTRSKLADFGSETYLKAALRQAGESISQIEKDIHSEKKPEDVIEVFNAIGTRHFENVTKENILLIFQPKYHPIVRSVKSAYVEMLKHLECDESLVDKFTSHFNDSIQHSIEKEFGDDYAKHLIEIEGFIIDQQEARLLQDTVELGRIGFSSQENLEYEETFGFWKPLRDLQHGENYDYDYNPDENDDEFDDEPDSEDEEFALKPVTELIDRYFGRDDENLEKLLFLIADFGKGKSVFMRRYASRLARHYINTREGYFPIYFNLREFKHFSTDSRLGIISDFLLTRYGINIAEEDFNKNKRFIFLMDSLDESGELSKESICQVIKSVKCIQHLDKQKHRFNRIVIASRPLNEGLEEEIKNNSPYLIEREEGRKVEYFVSLYGFKKEQFNNWLTVTLRQKKNSLPSVIDEDGLIADILRKLDSEDTIDIYDILLENNTLGKSELRRPIFAYMIYQLILNNIDFVRSGKIGIYLSFLNLLTKDAKHINDPSYRVSLEEEFHFRNLLHATAALWMYERHHGNPGFMKKADLCRVIEGKDDGEPDMKVLERNKGSELVDIEFLSHSYFGENTSTLHFQHQSFAEILLAEYYLKIFLKYALDEEDKVEEARAKLHLGEPTGQTITFFIEMLALLKESVEPYTEGRDDILEKRKLLFPLMAALSNKKLNTLFSHSLHHGWYKRYVRFKENQTEYPVEALINWPITETEINQIVAFAAGILNSKNDMVLSKIDRDVNLFRRDVVALHDSNIYSMSNTIDRWFSLLIGDTFYTDISGHPEVKLFNRDYNIDFNVLLNLLSLYNGVHSPDWMRPLFRGIDMRKNADIDITITRVLNMLDLSYSHLKCISFTGCFIGAVNFNYSTCENVYFSLCYFWGIKMSEVEWDSANFSQMIFSGVYVNNFNSYYSDLLSLIDDTPIYIRPENLIGFFRDFVLFLKSTNYFFDPSESGILKQKLNFIPAELNSHFWELANEDSPRKYKKHKSMVRQIYTEVYKLPRRDVNEQMKYFDNFFID